MWTRTRPLREEERVSRRSGDRLTRIDGVIGKKFNRPHRDQGIYYAAEVLAQEMLEEARKDSELRSTRTEIRA